LGDWDFFFKKIEFFLIIPKTCLNEYIYNIISVLNEQFFNFVFISKGNATVFYQTFMEFLGCMDRMTELLDRIYEFLFSCMYRN
jgi:hypothetical protein